MTYYQETLEKAKTIISESKITSEEKTFLSGLVPKLSLDMLEVFVWTMEEDPGNAEAVVAKTRQWIATATDSAEMKKAIDADKKAIELLLAEEEVAALKAEPV